MNDLRETGEYHPRPSGNFDGQTRCGAMKALLAKHEASITVVELPEGKTFLELLLEGVYKAMTTREPA